jgi:threonine/homoserine/homoserine lactone efflux protein
VFAPDVAFVALAGTAIASPGPGVVLTLTNALRYGQRPAWSGILGIASGSLAIASLSATGLGLLLAASPLAFALLTRAGAAYLLWLAWRLWNAPALTLGSAREANAGHGARYREGLLMQLGNPQALVFFIALFPPFLHGEGPSGLRFATLVASYALLIAIIHGGYAAAARLLQHQLVGARGQLVNRAAALAFVGFAVAALAGPGTR